MNNIYTIFLTALFSFSSVAAEETAFTQIDGTQCEKLSKKISLEEGNFYTIEETLCSHQDGSESLKLIAFSTVNHEFMVDWLGGEDHPAKGHVVEVQAGTDYEWIIKVRSNQPVPYDIRSEYLRLD